MTVALLVVGAIAAVCWLVGHKGWGIGWKLVFWVALLAVLWVLVAVGGVPQPSGLGALFCDRRRLVRRRRGEWLAAYFHGHE
jgi:hypothetical protein